MLNLCPSPSSPACPGECEGCKYNPEYQKKIADEKAEWQLSKTE